VGGTTGATLRRSLLAITCTVAPEAVAVADGHAPGGGWYGSVGRARPPVGGDIGPCFTEVERAGGAITAALLGAAGGAGACRMPLSNIGGTAELLPTGPFWTGGGEDTAYGFRGANWLAMAEGGTGGDCGLRGPPLSCA
jgi:hypothetical protein